MRMRAVESCVECGVRSAECGGALRRDLHFSFLFSFASPFLAAVSLDNELSRYYTTYPRPNRID